MTTRLAPMVIEEATRTYEIVTTTQTFRITIPATWKTTFGPVVGVAGKAAYDGGMSFRVWESDKLQRGLWLNVVSFRDLSIPVEVRAVRKFGSDDWYADEGKDALGTVERGWKPPDEIKERPVPEPVEDEDSVDNASYMTAVRAHSSYATRKSR